MDLWTKTKQQARRVNVLMLPEALMAGIGLLLISAGFTEGKPVVGFLIGGGLFGFALWHFYTY